MVTIGEGLKYPFKKFSRLFNIYWLLIPIWGWLVFCGYMLRVVRSISQGKKKELPAIRPFKGLVIAGLWALLFGLLLQMATFVMMIIPILGWLAYVYLVLIAPILYVQFAQRNNIGDGIDIVEASKTIFSSFGRYLLAWLKSFVVGLIWILASIPLITIPITFPAIIYSQNYFFANFYHKVHKK